jgi:hypothetical protein
VCQARTSGIVTLTFGRRENREMIGVTHSGDGSRRKGRVYILEPDAAVRTLLARIANP